MAELRAERRILDRHAAEIKWVLSGGKAKPEEFMWDPLPKPPLTEKQRAAIGMIQRAMARAAATACSKT